MKPIDSIGTFSKATQFGDLIIMYFVFKTINNYTPAVSTSIKSYPKLHITTPSTVTSNPSLELPQKMNTENTESNLIHHTQTVAWEQGVFKYRPG